MSDSMTFPDTVEEFMEKYKVVDTDGVYMSKGSELVPIFRMMQWFEQLPSAQPEQTEIIRCKDCNKASKCYGDVIMRSRGGRNIYCPLEFCSLAERRTDEQTD